MSYRYNPLLQQNLQKLQDIPEPPAPVYDSELSTTSENAVQNKVVTSAIEDTNTKKVSKFFTSINEIEIGEIGEYQGETNQNYTRGFFYEHRDSVTITELQTTRDYNFSLYLDAYKAGQLYHRQYFIAEQQSGLTASQFLVATASINTKRVSVSLLGVNFFSCNETDTYTNNFGTYYVYPYAEIQDGSNIYVDYDNPVTLVNNKIYYDNTELNFTQYAYSTKIYFGMEINTHYIYVWLPISSRWIAFLIDSAQAHAAYTPTWSYFEAVNYLTKSSLSPSVSLTVNDYEFSDQTPYVQTDTQPDLYRLYLEPLYAGSAEAILISSLQWGYDNNGMPFPASLCIVYLKNENRFLFVSTFPNSYEQKLYYFFIPAIGSYSYSIGGVDPSFTVIKEYSLFIIYPSAQSFDENNSMPINSRQLLNFRTATASLNGLMSAADKAQLNTLDSQVNRLLYRINNISITYGEWKTKTNTLERDYWDYNPPTTSHTIIHYDVEVVCLSLTGQFFINVARAVGYTASGMCIETWSPSGATGTFQYREVIYTI